MSAWGEMRRRSAGELIRKEDEVIEYDLNVWGFSIPDITISITARVDKFEKELNTLKKQIEETSSMLNKFNKILK